jgi:hypothetical protein
MDERIEAFLLDVLEDEGNFEQDGACFGEHALTLALSSPSSRR